MNIYDARKLQKELYKRAKTDAKLMTCSIIDGALHYHNIARISTHNYRIIDKEFITAISQSVELEDVRIFIFYKDKYNPQNWPEGMYISELIKID